MLARFPSDQSDRGPPPLPPRIRLAVAPDGQRSGRAVVVARKSSNELVLCPSGALLANPGGRRYPGSGNQSLHIPSGCGLEGECPGLGGPRLRCARCTGGPLTPVRGTPPRRAGSAPREEVAHSAHEGGIDGHAQQPSRMPSRSLGRWPTLAGSPRNVLRAAAEIDRRVGARALATSRTRSLRHAIAARCAQDAVLTTDSGRTEGTAAICRQLCAAAGKAGEGGLALRMRATSFPRRTRLTALGVA